MDNNSGPGRARTTPWTAGADAPDSAISRAPSRLICDPTGPKCLDARAARSVLATCPVGDKAASLSQRAPRGLDRRTSAPKGLVGHLGIRHLGRSDRRLSRADPGLDRPRCSNQQPIAVRESGVRRWSPIRDRRHPHDHRRRSSPERCQQSRSVLEGTCDVWPLRRPVQGPTLFM